MRKIIVFSTKAGSGSAVTFMSDDTKWGQFRETLVQEGLYNSDSMQAVLKETKLGLSHDDAALPEGDFTLFLLPIKTKSGAPSTEQIIERLDEVILQFSELYYQLKESLANTPAQDAEFQALLREAEELLGGLER